MEDPKPVVAENMVVSMHYVLRNSAEQVLDQSAPDSPLTYLHGHGQIIPGLATELVGLGAGEEKSVIVAPADAYGEFNPEARQLIPSNMFPADMPLTPGTSVQMQDQAGNLFQAQIVEAQGENMLLDFNHPLAGETLHFDVRIVDVRHASAEELDHGHAH